MTDTDSAQAVAAVLRDRRSIDLYEAEPVGAAVLREAFDLARWAPNHRLTEPWRFYVFGERTTAAFIEIAAELDAQNKGPAAGEARRKRLQAVPGFFVITCRRHEDAAQEREDYAACCCAAQNLALYLWARGVGVKWTTGGVTRSPRLFELVGIDPAKEFLVGLFWYGRPRVVPTQKRHPVEELVTDLP